MKFLYKFQKQLREPLGPLYRPFNRTMGMSADSEQPQGVNCSCVSFQLVLFPVLEQISKSIAE